MAIPYIDRNPKRLARKRPFAIIWGIAWIIIVGILSHMGTPAYGIEIPAATRIVQDLAPEEGLGTLRVIPFGVLQQGIYYVSEDYGQDLCPDLTYQPDPENDVNKVIRGCPALSSVFYEFSDRLLEAEQKGDLPQMNAAFLVEDWAPDIKKVTPHIEWVDPESGEWKVCELDFFLHRDRDRNK